MLAVIVPVMQVRIMRVAVRHPSMRVRVGMRLVSLPREPVAMLMMLIVTVIYHDLTRISCIERFMPWRN